jgi:hypothetical protein
MSGPRMPASSVDEIVFNALRETPEPAVDIHKRILASNPWITIGQVKRALGRLRSADRATLFGAFSDTSWGTFRPGWEAIR